MPIDTAFAKSSKDFHVRKKKQDALANCATHVAKQLYANTPQEQFLGVSDNENNVH